MNNNTTPYSPKVGDIFLMSWGYDQTNVNFFQVTRTTPKGIYVREIGTKSDGGEGFMCRNVKAVKNSFLNQSQWCGGFDGKNSETFHRLKPDGKSFSIKGRYYAYLWHGEHTYESWYA